MELLYILSVIFLHCFIPSLAARIRASQCPNIVRETGNYASVYNGICYMFVNREEFWNDAANACHQFGGDLLTIKDAGIMTFIKNELASRALNWQNQGVWIGAHYYDGRGWEWTTGEKMIYQYWANGEPSKTFGILKFEQCALMRREDGWRWHDYHCGTLKYHYNYICQFPIAHTYNQQGHSAHSSAGHEEDNGNSLILATVIGLAALVIFAMFIIFFIYRRRQKNSSEEAVVRFENLSYGPVTQLDRSQSVSLNGAGDNVSRGRPISNIYMSPEEVHTLYEEVNKEVNHGVNTYTKDVNCLQGQPPPPPPPRSDSGSASSVCDGTCSRDVTVDADRASGSVPSENEYLVLRDDPEDSNEPLIGATAAASPEAEKGSKATNVYVDMNGGSKSSGLDVDPCEKEKLDNKMNEHTYTNTSLLKSEVENPYEDLDDFKSKP